MKPLRGSSPLALAVAIARGKKMDAVLLSCAASRWTCCRIAMYRMAVNVPPYSRTIL
jgi:hypothetical protein